MPKSPKVRVTLVHKSGPVPAYATDGSNAIDLATTEEIQIRPGDHVLVPTNVVIDYPAGYSALVLLRSSTFKRYGVIMPNGIGLIDRDYNGKNDVVTVSLYNMKARTATIPAGERIAQLLFVKSERVEIEVGDFASDESRGGFGSTN